MRKRPLTSFGVSAATAGDTAGAAARQSAVVTRAKNARMASSPVKRRNVALVGRPSGGGHATSRRPGGYVLPDRDEIGPKLRFFCGESASATLRHHCPWLARRMPSGRHFLHDLVERGLPLEADPGAVGQRDGAPFHLGVVREPAEGTKHPRIGLRPAEAEPGRDRQRHLVPAMRKHGRLAPPFLREHVEGARVLRDTVGLGRVTWMMSRSARSPPKRTRFCTSWVE